MGLLSLLLWSLLLLLVSVAVYSMLVFRKRAKYYKKYGIPYLGSGIGRSIRFFMGKLNIVSFEFEVYKEAISANAPIAGMSDILAKSRLQVTDLELMKNIYVKDFDHFVNRRPVNTTASNKYFRKMLFGMEGDQWKGIRAKLSPCFTTGKIRRMFQIFNTSSERMDRYIENMIPAGEMSADINFSKIFPKYTMDVIASCAFGVDSKCWEVAPDQRSKFEQMGYQFQFDAKALFRFLLTLFAPRLTDMLGVEAMDYESTNYFSTVMKQVMKQRRETGERREDFLQLMMDVQQGLVKADEESQAVMNGSDSKENFIAGVNESKVTFDEDDVISNGLIFLLGGFDTTQSALLFATYCLALEPEVQEKLHKEVKQAMDKNGGKLAYEDLLEMRYLDMVINESLRLYPPSTATERSCTRDYQVPGTDFVIKKGEMVAMPIHPVHHDPRYYPNPTKFIPERFNPEEKAARHPYTFMPFGLGPRNCIAMRFALVKVKTVIAQIVASYKFAPCPKTAIPMEFGSGVSLKPKNDMWINVTSRN